MKIKIINPNTTQSMTESIENLARRVARSDTQVWAVTPASGPDSIECYVDEYLAVPGVLKEVIRGDREEGADAFIIACFGDPGFRQPERSPPSLCWVSVSRPLLLPNL